MYIPLESLALSMMFCVKYKEMLKTTDSEIIYVNVIQEVNINYLESNNYARGVLFAKQVQLAQRRNVPIKNCYLCDNHSLNERKFTNDHGIYCMRYKKLATQTMLQDALII